MRMEISSFCKDVPIFIDEKCCTKCVSIHHTPVKIEVHVSDVSDFEFLYLLVIDEENYRILKKEQNIVVEFREFPSLIAELFDHCSQSWNEENLKCCLSNGILQILQPGKVKALVQIELNFKVASESALRKHLVTHIKNFKVLLQVTNNAENP